MSKQHSTFLYFTFIIAEFIFVLSLLYHQWPQPVVAIVQSLSCVWLFATPWTAARQAPLSFTISQHLLRFMSVELVMLSNQLILCHPLLLPSVLTIRVFSDDLALHIRWPKYWSFSFSISIQNIQEWFPLGLTALISLQSKRFSRIQHHSWKASILWFSAFFTLQLLHPYMTTGKTIALTKGTTTSS